MASAHDQNNLLTVLTDTDARDKFAALAQGIFRLAFGLALVLRPARAALYRRLMIAVSDGRRTFRIATFLALRRALILRKNASSRGILENGAHLFAVVGFCHDWRAWLYQHGVLRNGRADAFVPDAKAADWWLGLSNVLAFVRTSGQSLAGLRACGLREVMLLVQYLHDVAPELSARRQITVGMCGIATNLQDIRSLVSAQRQRQERERKTYYVPGDSRPRIDLPLCAAAPMKG